MNDHNLTNPRVVHHIPDDTPTPVCWQCKRPLHEVPLKDITTRAHKRSYCSQTCYDAYIRVECDRLVREHVASDRYKPYVPTWTRAESARPENSSPAFTPDPEFAQQVAFHRRQNAKTPARKTAEAAANVVGFVIWMCVVSAIAALLFAACGISGGM